MPLTIGGRLGSYEILDALGAGGMGEVYRARDTKLNRDVAIKILPSEFALDAERLARFKREAQVLASLNHPNIGQIYGFDDANDVHALILELVEGPTLAERIGKDAIPVEEALSIARQIGEALQAAHEQGIIHRDLKPANIKLRPDGTVKVLDFGLAKLADPVGAGLQTGPSGLTASPTITTPAMTQMGLILGTAAYMSPEQAKGRPADRRSDVWAFGCVLFEMLTGKRAFDGEDVSDTLASVLKGQPDWNALPKEVPASVVALLRRCLDKDRKRRIADVSTVLFVIDEPSLAASAIAAPDHATARPTWQRAIPFVLSAVLVVATALLVLSIRPSQLPAGLTRFPLALPEGQVLMNRGGHVIAISPDGANIVYVANRQLYLRPLADMEARPIQGTSQDVETPFFSPDGRWVGFMMGAERKLKKIAITGGAAITVSDNLGNLHGASWDSDDQIVFGQASRGIFRVSANGGKPENIVAAKAGEIMHGPVLLPGGDVLMFTSAASNSSAGWDRARIVALSLKSGERKVLIDGGRDARYLPTGHIVYALGSTVLAVRFDAKTLQVIGGPVPVIEGVERTPAGTTAAAHFSVANNGSMVYVPQAGSTDLGLVLVDRAGVRKPLNVPPAAYGHPRISPNGKQLAVHTEDEKDHVVWIYDLTGPASPRRLTFEGSNDRPMWTPDGERIAFRSNREGDDGDSLYWQRADGNGSAERLTSGEPGTSLQPEAWSPDGKVLIFSVSQGGNRSLWKLDVGAGHKPQPLVPAYSSNCSISPDGRWLAYQTLDQGRTDVFVQFLPSGSKFQISTGGRGRSPLWAADGKQLFYLQLKGGLGSQIMSVDIQTQPSFALGKTTSLPIEGIRGPGPRNYDITPDGKYFVVMLPSGSVKSDKAPQEQINVTLNWFEELKQRVPAK